MNNEFNYRAYYKDISGQLFFGGLNGIDAFYPGDIVENTNIPDVLITSFTVDESRATLDKPIEDVNEVELPYSDNSFVIDFVALDYISPVDNQYAYMLDGFDKKWHYCNANLSFATYTNIPSGEYTFRVMASNSDGIWNKEGVSLKIIIVPPFWQTWWFILLMIAASLLLILMIVRLRTRTLKMRAKELERTITRRTFQLADKTGQLEKQMEQRVEFTRALVHELKTPLTPMIGASEILNLELEHEPHKSYASSIFRGANQLSKRIDELVDVAKGEVGLLELNCKELDPLLLFQDVIDYMTPEAKRRNQTLSMDLPASLRPIYGDSERLKQILLNLLTNAFKFTPKGGHILLKAQEIDHHLIIEVIDNGSGINDKAQKLLFKPYQQTEKAHLEVLV